MKYLAILKDSFREAVDTRVFFFMVILSLILAVAGLSMSFQAETGPGTMHGLVQQELFQRQFQGGRGRKVEGIAGEIARVEVPFAVPKDGGREGPDKAYRVLFVIAFSEAQEAAKVRSSPARARTLIEEVLAAGGDNPVFEIKDVRSPKEAKGIPNPGANPNYALVEVDTEPTQQTRVAWPHDTWMFFGAVHSGKERLGRILYILENFLVGGLGSWIAIIVSIIITAFFIPNMLRKGTVDLLLVKPIHRGTLLIYKFIGGLTFIFLNTVVLVGGVWLALALRSGVWAPGFLVCILTITFFFTVLYSVCTLFSVVSGSPITGILMTLLGLALMVAVGWIHWNFELRRELERQGKLAKMEETGWHTTIDMAHFVLPRVRDLDYLTAQVLSRQLLTNQDIKNMELDIRSISWTESLIASFAFIAVMLSLACLRFAYKDF